MAMRRLNCAVQNYAWGKRGSDSKVAQLKTLENEGFETDEEQTYAELWMGTHPNGPSRVMPEAGDFVEGAEEGHAGIFLIELLETHPHYLGDLQDVGDLPFMFKVLSINKALSIQVCVCVRVWVPDTPKAHDIHGVACVRWNALAVGIGLGTFRCI